MLQVRSILDGEALFSDRSVVFWLLAALGELTGDVIVGNKLAACLFGALTAVGGALAGWRWTGSLAGGIACGVWWAASPLHLGISAEFLKNSGGVAVLALLIAALAGRSRRALIAAVGLALLGPLVHKLTGVLGLILLAGRLLATRTSPRLLLAAAGLGALVVLSVGLLRPADLTRLIGAEDGAERTMLLLTGRLIIAEKAELLAAHLAPLLLGLLSRRPALRGLGLAVLPVSLIILAPGLPLGWDETAWRLLLMSFVPVGLVAAALSAHRPLVCAAVVLAGLSGLPSSVDAQRGRSPDYAALSAILPAIQAQVPDGGRLIAHRGLCGFLWAEGGILCENFQPQGTDLSGYWRVVYGFSAARLSGGQRPPVPLLPGYVLLHEPDWQTFASGAGARFSLTHNPRNPHKPRPGFVYGPDEDGAP